MEPGQNRFLPLTAGGGQLPPRSITSSEAGPTLVLKLFAAHRYRILVFRTQAYEGPDRYGFVERDGVELHLSEAPEHDRTRDGSEIYLYVSDADALYASWSSSGVKGRFIPPHDTPYGLREFAFVDRDGTAHRVGSPLPEDQ